jgi:NADPH2:quinone reductase
MRAIQIQSLNGPDEALALVDIPEPEPSHPLTPGSGVLVDVHAAGVSFPEVLQTRGEYQFKPDLPFVPGSEVGGIRRDTGERVAAFTFLGAFAGSRSRPSTWSFRFPTSGASRRARLWSSTTTPPTSRWSSAGG